MCHTQIRTQLETQNGDTVFCNACCILHIARCFCPPSDKPITLVSSRHHHRHVRNDWTHVGPVLLKNNGDTLFCSARCKVARSPSRCQKRVTNQWITQIWLDENQLAKQPPWVHTVSGIESTLDVNNKIFQQELVFFRLRDSQGATCGFFFWCLHTRVSSSYWLITVFRRYLSYYKQNRLLCLMNFCDFGE